MRRAQIRAPNSPHSDESVRTGTQAIARAATLLRLIARCNAEGARLSELTRLAGLSHSTIHRILRCLIDERLVVQDEPGRRYRLGPLNSELSLAVPNKIESSQALHLTLERIAQYSGHTAFLVACSDTEFVCVDRVAGDSPIPPTALHIGGRRPLYIGAAGLALLAAHDDLEIERILTLHKRDLSQRRTPTPAFLRRAVALTRERGYAVARDTAHVGITSIGMTVPSAESRPAFAISVSTFSARLNPEIVNGLRDLLASELARATTGAKPKRLLVREAGGNAGATIAR